MTSERAQQKSSIPAQACLVWLLCCCLLPLMTALPAQAQWPHVTVSADGTPISYEVHGAGEPTLVFTHGWSCDSRYWRLQVPHFAARHRVVLLDLAGHGHSGLSRQDYTMRSFGEDVRAVAEAVGGDRFILIGHSMGGSVIAEAAALMPGKVVGLIGVDTLEDVEYRLTREQFEQMTAPLRLDFRQGSRKFVEQMIAPQTAAPLREWILDDMSAAPPEVAMSAMDNMMAQFISGEIAAIFDSLPHPVVSVNGDLWPVNQAANRRHMHSYEAIILPDADHFLMMNRAEEFNQALERAIGMVGKAAQRQQSE